MMSSNGYQLQESNAKSVCKPRFPLNAYNLFLQVIRRRILDGTDSFNLPITLEELQMVAFEYKNKPEKRRHRKTEGMIGFRGLSREASARWKKIDKKTRNMLEEQATLEKLEYVALLKFWNDMHSSNNSISVEQQQQQQPVHHQLNQHTDISQGSSCSSVGLCFSQGQGFEEVTNGCLKGSFSEQPFDMQQFQKLQIFVSNLEKNGDLRGTPHEWSPLEPKPLLETGVSFQYKHSAMETNTSWVGGMDTIPHCDAEHWQPQLPQQQNEVEPLEPRPLCNTNNMPLQLPLQLPQQQCSDFMMNAHVVHFHESLMPDPWSMLSTEEFENIFP